MPPVRHTKKKHYDTPTKAALRYTKQFLEDKGHEHSNRELFRYFGIDDTTGRRILYQDEVDFLNETRGRKKALWEVDIQKIERLLYDDTDARSLPYYALPNAANVDFEGSEVTIRRVIHQKYWRKCTTCTHNWTAPSHAEERKKAAQKALELRPKPEDWENIRWSDETHFSCGPEGLHKAFRNHGERDCPDCAQPRPGPGKDEPYRCHAWAAVGHNFKSELVWYTASKSNDAIPMKTYRDQILDPIVKPWLDRGDDFILQEDGTIGHGKQNNNNIVRQWKEKHGLKWDVDTVGSPDLSPMDNAWRAPKAYMKEHAILDEHTLRESAEDGWEAVTEDSINEWVHSMPQRMEDVVACNGQLTGW